MARCRSLEVRSSTREEATRCINLSAPLLRRFADFHSDEDRIEGAFDLEVGNVPQELAYCTFKAQRQLDTIIEEFVGL